MHPDALGVGGQASGQCDTRLVSLVGLLADGVVSDRHDRIRQAAGVARAYGLPVSGRATALNSPVALYEERCVDGPEHRVAGVNAGQAEAEQRMSLDEVDRAVDRV